MARLSRPIAELSPHYEVVVVGSGYGAAVAVARLARAGFRVCLLERGREFQPGDYPDSPQSALAEMQFDLPDKHVGKEDGLYDFRANPDLNVFVGCGLGGTSLVNANVALRPVRAVLEDRAWPALFRSDIDNGLERGFAAAEQMLRFVPLPGISPEKYRALEKSATALGKQCVRPPITVNFAVDGPNHVGVMQHPCTMCGDCISGCNVGAKNTLITSYLPDAVNHGAEIYCEARVSHLERFPAGWRVHFDWVGSGRKAFDAPPMSVTADVVVLGAGALGSTEILLRSRDRGLTVSPEVGKHFTGNGDFLGFAYNAEEPINGMGYGLQTPEGVGPVGPCITGLIDFRTEREFAEGFVIEEGAIPSPLAPLLTVPLGAAADTLGRPSDLELGNVPARLARKAQSLIAGPYRGAMHHTQTYLVMSHDDGAGALVLQNGRIRVRWPGVGSQGVFERVSESLAKATRPLSAAYLRNPLWTDLFQQSLVTVHPLGGCAMGESGATGVVDHKCQVFDGASDTVHTGLYICDGAVIPRPLGVNPLLTITALAERAMALAAQERGRPTSYHLPSAPKTPSRAPAIGIRFTETMRGFISLDPTLDYRAAEADGRGANRRLDFTVTIEAEDLARFLGEPSHLARLVGTVDALALAPEPLMISRGEFNLFVEGEQASPTREMRYRMSLCAADGREYHLSGFKTIHDDRGFDLWADTTTLFVELREGPAQTGRLLGRGMLRITAIDFARQLTTLQVLNASTSRERIEALARFGRFFAGTLFDTYGGFAVRPSVFNPAAPPRIRRPLRAPVPDTVGVSANDGTQLLLTRYCGGPKGPVMLVHGLGVSSLIFTIDTIETNLVEYLCANGYDVWLLDLRVSILLPSAHAASTADEVATQDYPAAVRTVRELTGAGSIQVVAHCYGATTFTMALLSGLEGVRSAVISQVSTHVLTPPAARIKAGLHLPDLLQALGVSSLTAYTDSHEDWLGQLYNRALALGPVAPEERCTSAICHRIQFMYGLLYEHAQLNAATHAALHEMFGVANMRAFEHLATMIRAEHVVDAQGNDTYLPHPERMRLPLFFIHGERNECFLPESTERTVAALSAANGSEFYARRVIPRYGHIDCIFGRNAARDVYPHVLAHLEQTA